jgi:FkbM family methyltransferase
MISTARRAVNRKSIDVLRHLRLNRRHITKCKVHDYTIALDVESEIERFRARTYATKEPETLEWIDRYFQAGDVMYDVGANIGLYSLYAAKRLRGECKVFAFEPEALNHAKLSKNVFLNGLSGIVLPCCVAVTDRLCFDTFNLHPRNFESMSHGQLVSGSALHSFGAPEDYNGHAFQPFHQQGAVGVSVDDLWQAWNVDFPNHIKIDVDGLEEKIIAGAEQTLQDRRLRSVLVEISASKAGKDPILRRLNEAGFTQITDFARHSMELLQGTAYEDSINSVFIRK